MLKNNFKRLLNSIALVAVIGFSMAATAGTRDNFDACAKADSSWMRRWGQYVVAFNRSAAEKSCAADFGWGMFEVRSTGCSINGQWLNAGYYCNELSPGGN